MMRRAGSTTPAASIRDADGPMPSRRQFLAGAGALTLAVGAGGIVRHANAGGLNEPGFAPNAYIRIDKAGQITVISSYLEMGQGTFTGLATLAAEELDADIDQVRVEGAPADATKYANPVMSKNGRLIQGTGGSTAMAGSWHRMREAAAAARMMLLTAAARRWSVPPDTLEVDKGIVRHPATGRHGGYGEFVEAAALLPVPKELHLKQFSEFRLIGKAGTRRVDIPAKVDGSAIYTQDIKLPGMLVAVVAHPPRLWAKVRNLDAAAASAIPGVVAVVEFPGDNEIQAGVAVLARNTWIARQGRDALAIDWDESHALSISSEDIFTNYRSVSQTPGRAALDRGHIPDQPPQGGKFIEAVFEQPYLAHAAMEPMNCVVQIGDDDCHIWNGEQWHSSDQAAAAKELGLKPEQVKITQLYAGGSFGRRANPRSDYLRQAVRIARAARAQGISVPIKMVWMRENDMQAAQYRPLTVHRARLGLDGDGRLVSWLHRVVGQSFGKVTDADGFDHSLLEGIRDAPYAIPNFRVEQHNPATFAVPTQWLRSVGHTHTAFVVETLIEEAARQAGKDRYLYRRELISESRYLGVMDLVAQTSGWRHPLPAGSNGEKRGRGMAIQKAFGTYVAQVAEVTVRPDNSYRVDRIYCVVDCGAALNPDNIIAQMEGGVGFGLSFLRQKITLRDGRIEQSNFNDYPVLRMSGMPPIDVSIIPSQEAPTGVGEPGVPCTAPAVANALADATGMVIRSLPLSDDIRIS